MLKRLVVLGLVTLVISGCGEPTVSCGTFSFTVGPPPNRGINMTLNFDFNMSACDPQFCITNQVVYVQIIRIIDLNTGAFLSPNQEQTNRIVDGRADVRLNGWAVDRLATRVWGYYGRNDNGTFASTLTPGSNTTDAILRDTPSGWPDQSLFEAVSVPVSIDPGSVCVNHLAGYYQWGFSVGTGGAVGDEFDGIGVDWQRDAFDESVIEWDNDAPNLNKNTFPAFSRMTARLASAPEQEPIE